MIKFMVKCAAEKKSHVVEHRGQVTSTPTDAVCHAATETATGELVNDSALIIVELVGFKLTCLGK